MGDVIGFALRWDGRTARCGSPATPSSTTACARSPSASRSTSRCCTSAACASGDRAAALHDDRPRRGRAVRPDPTARRDPDPLRGLAALPRRPDGIERASPTRPRTSASRFRWIPIGEGRSSPPRIAAPPGAGARLVRLFVTGPGGYLGRELRRQAPAAGWEIARDRRLRRSSTCATTPRCARAVVAARPDVVVHTAYRMDDASVDFEGTRAVATAAVAAGARLVHLSSDIILRGSATRALTEADEPDPVTPYGVSKLEAEHLCPPDALMVRTSLIYGGPGALPRTSAPPLEVADGVRDMSFFTDERRCPMATGRSPDRGPRAGGAGHHRPPAHRRCRCAHAAGVRAVDLRAPRARPRRAARRARAAPAGPRRWSWTARERAPCCACPCAARARSCRREGDRGRRRGDRPHDRGVPARGRHRRRRRRARGATGHHLRGGGGALVPLPGAPDGAD